MAKQFDCPFIETSAKQRIGIDEAFNLLVEKILEKYKKYSNEGKEFPGIKIHNRSQNIKQKEFEEEHKRQTCC